MSEIRIGDWNRQLITLHNEGFIFGVVIGHAVEFAMFAWAHGHLYRGHLLKVQIDQLGRLVGLQYKVFLQALVFLIAHQHLFHVVATVIGQELNEQLQHPHHFGKKQNRTLCSIK